MKTDGDLLWEFARRGNQDAFGELVKRHINVVYSVACREAGDDISAAREVTRLVFVELAHKAATLERQSTLAGWLYTSVRHVTADLRRERLQRAGPDRFFLNNSSIGCDFKV
jgi:DNA-directed RNA polymerase specialized sigma24 family protein